MFVKFFLHLKVLVCPSAFRAKSIYHVCIEVRQEFSPDASLPVVVPLFVYK